MESVTYSAQIRAGVLALLETVPYKGLIWQWQFEQNPFCETFHPVVFVDEHDRVIGFNGIVPVKAAHYGKPMDTVWSCDFFVASDYRGKGLGSRIKKELNQRADTIMTFGVSEKAEKVLTHLGWQRNDAIFSYRLLRRFDSYRALILGGVQLLNWLKGRRRPETNRFRIFTHSRLPAREVVDRLWAHSQDAYEKVVSREFAYLDWKYQHHPLARYSFVSAWEEDVLAGLMVTRFHRNQLKVVDYCGPAHASSLKAELIAYIRHQWRHAEQISLVTSDLEMGRCLCDQGFFRARTQPRFFARSNTNDENPAKGWFVMAGDSDGELLAAAYDNTEFAAPEFLNDLKATA